MATRGSLGLQEGGKSGSAFPLRGAHSFQVTYSPEPRQLTPAPGRPAPLPSALSPTPGQGQNQTASGPASIRPCQHTFKGSGL